MRQRTVVVLNGPNLNLLGEREPEVYGSETLADVEALCRQGRGRAGLALDFRQSNHEGVLVDAIHEVRSSAAGIVINAGALDAHLDRPARRARGRLGARHRGAHSATCTARGVPAPLLPVRRRPTG